MGDYRATYRRSIEDPEGFWADAARDILWRTEPSTVLDATRAPFYRWFPDGVLNTCENALDRHVADGHGGRRRAGLRQPGHRHPAHLHLRRAARGGRDLRRRPGLARRPEGRPGRHLPADGARRPSSRCSPAPGWGRCTPWCSAGSRRTSWPRGSRTPSRGSSSPRPAASRCRRVVEYKPLLDRALELSSHQPEHVVVLQRPQATAAMTAPRDLDWRDLVGRTRSPPSACRWPPPTRSTCSTRRARPPSPRASSATTAGTRSRCSGRCRTSTASAGATSGGPHPTSGGWSGHSYIVYAPLLVGATTVLYEGKPVGTPDAGAFWRVVAQYGVQALFTAPTAIRAVKKEDPEGCAPDDARRVVTAHPVPRRRAAGPGHLGMGDRAARRAGHRPLVADRDRLADRGQPARTRADADQAGLADRAGARLRRAGARPDRCGGRAWHRGSDLHQAAAAAGHAADAVGRRRPVRRVVPLGLRRLLPDRRRRVRRRRRLPVRDGSHRRRHQRRRATGSRPARWRPSSPAIRRWPSAA